MVTSMAPRAAVVAAAAAAALATGCDPELLDDTSLVRSPRVLAVRAVPAEAAPGKTVALRALRAGPDGLLDDASLGWAFCLARKPFTEPGPIDPACLDADDPAVIAPLGAGVEVSGAIPTEACRLFGPDRPAPLPGEPAGRPVDPDGTGGYYQPVRLRVDGGAPALAQVRLSCGLPAVTQAQLAEYRARRRDNENPTIADVAIGGDAPGALVPLERDPGAVTPVAAGAVVELTVSWPACGDDEAAACGGAEPYVWFDPETRTLPTRREAIRASWFVTGGELAAGHTGRAEDDRATTTDNRWTAPSTPGPAHLWIVLRDDRGGAGWASFRFEVTP
jgi:hypothetical protein